MKLITKEIEKQFEKNMKLPEDQRKAVLKLFTPFAGCTWYISEKNGDSIFGFTDLGNSQDAELGYGSLAEVQELKSQMGMRGTIERDIYYTPELLMDIVNRYKN